MSWDLRGKTVLITGATHGIGLEASVALARQGARVVMVGRDPARTEAAVADVRARSGSREVTPLLCDFSSQKAIRELAQVFLAKHDRLDVLVNNAGGVNKKRSLTEDGIETTFAVNHLGYFLLTHLLLDLLVRSAPARVVSVASIGHRRGSLDFADLGYENGYGIMKAYTRSKLANVLFANELARRLEGTGVTSNSLHPGVVATNIWSGAPAWAKPLIRILYRPFFISAEQGAQTIVQLAASPELEGVTGKYFEEGKLAVPAPLARDEALAKRLWEVSAKLVGLKVARYTIHRYHVFSMIQSFADQATADLFAERPSRAARRIPSQLWSIVQRKLKWIDVAQVLSDLASPPGNRLEALKGDQRGRHSIRVNDQYRLTFRWEGNHAYEVRCEDYHA